MYWLVFQTVIEKEEFNKDKLSNDISIITLVRKVEAATKEEAIGKFIVDTSTIDFKRRIEPLNVFEFDKLRTI